MAAYPVLLGMTRDVGPGQDGAGKSAPDTAPGRSCPLHYHYAARAFRRAPEIRAETLLIAGGLYGNPQALDALLALAATEPGGASLVFNGDFHWFDVDPSAYALIDDTVLRHAALRGNVETELAAQENTAGCGCAYPQWVGDAEVERSNRILATLKQTATADPGRRLRLGELPMHLLAQVGDIRVAIVHGDAQSLAGWAFAQEALRDSPAEAARQLAATGAQVLASSHTCLPVLAEFELPQGRSVLINNGAAGMPNFFGTRHGVVTRISLRPGRDVLYGAKVGEVHVEALQLDYDTRAWDAQFDAWWPAGSPAAQSYRARIAAGPRYTMRDAMRGLLAAGRR